MCALKIRNLNQYIGTLRSIKLNHNLQPRKMCYIKQIVARVLILRTGQN
jgi:hypothetical protein